VNIDVRKRGTEYTLNGKATRLRMATSFGWLGLIRQRRLKDANLWCDRMNDIGMHGMRVFGEYAGWAGNFFFKQVAPLYDTWDWNDHRTPGSWIKINKVNDRVLSKAIELLQKHGLIMEYVVSATAKARRRPDGFVVEFQEHMCRAAADWFRGYEDDFGPTNAMYEVINEYDTVKDQFSMNQLGETFRRWHVRDYPGSLISASPGGGGEPEYPIGGSGATDIRLHPERGKRWKASVSAPIIEKLLRDFKVPVYFNETNHVMEKDEWDEWIPQIPSWANISTKDHRGVVEQANVALEAGASYDLHWFGGMLTEPNRAMSRVELAWKESFNPSAPLPPPPPPPDEPPAEEEPSFWARLFSLLKGFLAQG
jgi:hypothetical protein